MKLQPLGLNPSFPFGAFGSDSADRYCLPAIAVERARAHCGREFAGKDVVVVGDSVHDVLCGRSLGVRAGRRRDGARPRPSAWREQRPDALLPSFADVGAAMEAILG